MQAASERKHCVHILYKSAKAWLTGMPNQKQKHRECSANAFTQPVSPSPVSLQQKGRKGGGGAGGVLIAVRNTLDGSAAPELEVEDCELLWVRVKLKGRRTLYLCAHPSPHTH